MKKDINDILNLIDENTWIISDTHFGHNTICNFEPCRLTQMRIDGYEADEHDKWIIDNWNSTVGPDDIVLHLGDFAFKQGYHTKEFEDIYSKLQFSDIKHLKNSLKLTKPGNIEEISKMVFAKSDKKLDKEQFKSLISNYMPESEYFTRYKDLLNGTIIMVLGNHDPKPNDNKLKGIEVIDGFYWNQGNIPNRVHNPDQMFSGFIKEFGGERFLFSHYPVFNEDEWDRKNKMIAPRIKLLESIFTTNNCNTNIHGHTHSLESTFDNSINVCFEHTNYRPKKLGELFIK